MGDVEDGDTGCTETDSGPIETALPVPLTRRCVSSHWNEQ